jgi:uncharacterized protein YicC (UPF0701 family)
MLTDRESVQQGIRRRRTHFQDASDPMQDKRVLGRKINGLEQDVARLPMDESTVSDDEVRKRIRQVPQRRV